MISGNMVGAYSPMGKTFIIEDTNGNEITGVVVEQETVFTATTNDVREGKIYAGDEGVKTGEKNIPAYVTLEGFKMVPVGSELILSVPYWDYTKFQGIVCDYNNTTTDSVSANKVAINDNLYSVQTTISISTIQKDSGTQSINLGLINTSDKPYLIRYFLYKEIY